MNRPSLYTYCINYIKCIYRSTYAWFTIVFQYMITKIYNQSCEYLILYYIGGLILGILLVSTACYFVRFYIWKDTNYSEDI